MRMKYRRLGKTHIQISELSYGGSPLGGAFGIVDEHKGIQSLRRAIDLGINFIDTSPLYGSTRSEALIGHALKGVSRETFYIGTKVGRFGPTDFDFSVNRVTESVNESLRRLGVDYLDVVLCHDIEFVPVAQVFNDAIPALQKLKESGKIRAIGVSGYPLKIYEMALDAVDLDVVLVYCHYNLVDTTLENLIPRLNAKHIGIISASPMGMGLLTGQELPPWHPAPVELREKCLEAFQFCESVGAPLKELALQFATASHEIHSTLVGMPSISHVDENVSYYSTEFDPQHLNDVLAILEPVRNNPWPSGLPENN